MQRARTIAAVWKGSGYKFFVALRILEGVLNLRLAEGDRLEIGPRVALRDSEDRSLELVRVLLVDRSEDIVNCNPIWHQ